MHTHQKNKLLINAWAGINLLCAYLESPEEERAKYFSSGFSALQKVKEIHDSLDKLVYYELEQHD